LKSLKCQNCGAALKKSENYEIYNCKHCGSTYKELSKLENPESEIKDLVGKTNELIDEIKSNEIDKLQNEIKFLENEYKLTHHPSIIQKIKIAQNKLSAIQLQ